MVVEFTAVKLVKVVEALASKPPSNVASPVKNEVVEANKLLCNHRADEVAAENVL